MGRLGYCFSLRRLAWEERKITRLYRRKRRDAEKAGQPLHVLQLLAADEGNERLNLEEQRQTLVSFRLVEEARRLLVPYPSPGITSTAWVAGSTMGSIRLTQVAYFNLHQRIRQERKERRDAWLAYSGLIGAVAGLLGVGVAFVSAITTYRSALCANEGETAGWR